MSPPVKYSVMSTTAAPITRGVGGRPSGSRTLTAVMEYQEKTEEEYQEMPKERPVLLRTRSLNAPSPVQQFGPCGRIMKNSAMVMTIQDPASQRLTWYKPPLTVLIIKKIHDAAVISPFIQLVSWFTELKRMVVFVEEAIMDDPLLTKNPAFTPH